LAALVTGTGIIFTGACLLTGSHLSLLYLSLLILGCGIGLRIIHINKISMTYAHTSNEVVIPFFHSFYSLGSILALLLCLGLSFIPQNTIGLQYVITGAIVMCLEITVSFV
jgi:Na+/citrate or Na+/malate symporter